jgi:hypothetical protein
MTITTGELGGIVKGVVMGSFPVGTEQLRKISTVVTRYLN